jgi:hypothetical protein
MSDNKKDIHTIYHCVLHLQYDLIEERSAILDSWYKSYIPLYKKRLLMIEKYLDDVEDIINSFYRVLPKY